MMRKHGKPGMGKPVRSSGKPKGSPPITKAISFEMPKPIKRLISVIRDFRKTETQ